MFNIIITFAAQTSIAHKLFACPLTAMASNLTSEWGDLKIRFHKLTDHQDFPTAPVEEMHGYKIQFGKTYVNKTYQSVYDTQPRYVAWLLDRAGSQAAKTPGQLNFLHYIKLRIVDAENEETEPRQQIPAQQSAAEPNSAKFVAEKPSASSAKAAVQIEGDDFDDYEEVDCLRDPAETGLFSLIQKFQNMEARLNWRLEKLEAALTKNEAAHEQ
jgi:hypothetical protein